MKRMVRISTIVSVLLVLAFLSVPLLAQNAPSLPQIDITGMWRERSGMQADPEVADYTGLPLNAAARAKADSWKASVQTLPERQCIPHPNPYSYNSGTAGLKITVDADPSTQRVVDYQMYGTWGHATQVIYMDGRPRPPEDAYHTFAGFTTGQWEGNNLTTYTDHIKWGYLRRNGVPTSDQTTLIKNWTRHEDNTLTAAVIVMDPVYLTEPFVYSYVWVLDPTLQMTEPLSCEVAVEEDRPEGEVPHWLPGTNPSLSEYSKNYGIPEDGVRGGAETTYPEYRDKLKDQYKRPEKCARFCCGGVGAAGLRGTGCMGGIDGVTPQ